MIDSSALMAILLGESEAERLVAAISRDRRRLVGAITALECSIVLEARHGEAGARHLDLLLGRADVRLVSFTPAQCDLARAAWRRFGKGRHPARLNMGDCCSYALAQASGEPLLFKGEDFNLTDVSAVSY